MNIKKIGNLGENIAIRYLIKNGDMVIGRNIKEGFDEIDIIGKQKDGDLVFYEVKTVVHLENLAGQSLGGFIPEDHLTWQKLKRITRACQKFAVRNEYLINEENGWRIDLIAITIKEGMRYDLHHYKNIS
jgi:putative endonuclease